MKFVTGDDAIGQRRNGGGGGGSLSVETRTKATKLAEFLREIEECCELPG